MPTDPRIKSIRSLHLAGREMQKNLWPVVQAQQARQMEEEAAQRAKAEKKFIASLEAPATKDEQRLREVAATGNYVAIMDAREWEAAAFTGFQFRLIHGRFVKLFQTDAARHLSRHGNNVYSSIGKLAFQETRACTGLLGCGLIIEGHSSEEHIKMVESSYRTNLLVHVLRAVMVDEGAPQWIGDERIKVLVDDFRTECRATANPANKDTSRFWAYIDLFLDEVKEPNHALLHDRMIARHKAMVASSAQRK